MQCELPYVQNQLHSDAHLSPLRGDKHGVLAWSKGLWPSREMGKLEQLMA